MSRIEAARKMIDGALLAEVFAKIAAEQAVIETKRRDFKAAVKGNKAAIRAHRDGLVAKGYGEKVVDCLLEEASLKRRLELIGTDLGEEDREILTLMREELGDFSDTPLGAAALAAEQASVN